MLPTGAAAVVSLVMCPGFTGSESTKKEIFISGVGNRSVNRKWVIGTLRIKSRVSLGTSVIFI